MSKNQEQTLGGNSGSVCPCYSLNITELISSLFPLYYLSSPTNFTIRSMSCGEPLPLFALR